MKSFFRSLAFVAMIFVFLKAYVYFEEHHQTAAEMQKGHNATLVSSPSHAL